MRLFNITNKGPFMSGLLSNKEDVFDQFLLSEAFIATGNTYTIDGHLNKSFYTDDELDIMRHEAAESGRIFSEDMIRWKSVKNFCYECLRGTKLPLLLKVNFCLSPENTGRFLATADTVITESQINSLNLNIKYDGGTLTCTTAVSLNIFTMDKSLENSWDEMVARFLSSHGYEYE